uniref:Golgi apparatus membrane protein TVP23 homolog n=1 Tax=Phallusia mammillata TaxID=59560 RepID=A0A6F9DWN3_9ASCI|nr:Golgi apparatus membrane protein TVP23 homolog B-like [Phallusia mammillata]
MQQDDTVLDFGEENVPKKRIKHPVACFFHIFFRLSAIIVYLMCGIIQKGFVFSFIVILLLLCADFWTVKNVSGRLLVGLRWWNKVDEDGQSQWIYESRKASTLKRHPVLAAESRIFWFGLVVCTLIWVFFFFTTLFTLNLPWLSVVIIALILSGANLFGFIRCKFSSRKQLGSMATKFIGAQMFKSMQSEETSHTPLSTGTF